MSVATIAVIVSVSVLAMAIIIGLALRCISASRRENAAARRGETSQLLTSEMEDAADVPYQVQRKLGDGTYGVVYLARRREDGKMVAVKVVPCSKPKQADEALKEYSMCAAVQGHPNVVKLLDLFQDTPIGGRDRGKSTTSLQTLRGVVVPKGSSTVVCIVSEYYAHGTLFDLLVRHKQQLGTRRGLPEPKVLDYTRQILAALAFMHKSNVIHRDIKPSNVLVADDEQTLALTDFGLSKEIIAGEYVKTRIGTYHYMAPEQMTGGKYNSKADVWAAGCLIYAMCTAKISTRDAVVMFTVRKSPDFESRLRSELRNMYSEELIAFMLRTLIEKPADRPGSEEALQEVEAIIKKRQASLYTPREE